MVKSKKKLRSILYVFAVVLTVLYFGKHFYRGVLDPTHQKISINAGKEVKELKLMDGSTVVLAPKARFHYPKVFSSEKRKVELVGGALLMISQNSAPFKLKLKKTVFNTHFGQLKVVDEGNNYTVEILDGDFEIEIYNSEGKLEDVKKVSKGAQLSVGSRVQVI